MDSECPNGGQERLPWTSAPTKKGAANRRIAAGTALKMKVKYKYIARLFDKSLRLPHVLHHGRHRIQLRIAQLHQFIHEMPEFFRGPLSIVKKLFGV